jgi:[pyruvate, water dikinase]-phosphate phosphotransferase / [pyruvate, water dikinase] kinase
LEIWLCQNGEQEQRPMSERTIFFLSDQTGVTAETLGHSLLTQFDSQKFRQVTLPFIDSEDKAREAVAKINKAAEKSAARPVVFSTLVQDEIRAIVRQVNGLHLDIFDVFLEPLESELRQKSSHTAGRAHGMSDIESYMKRIEATNFALANDDGGVTRNYEMADVILIGVSRSGKTPTCLYLALQYGVYAANYPLTDEEFDSGTLPEILVKQRRKLFGLTIAPARLRQVRRERRPLGNYASAQQVNYELRQAEKIFEKYGIPHVDTTEFSIEEIASRILDSTGVERRVRP